MRQATPFGAAGFALIVSAALTIGQQGETENTKPYDPPLTPDRLPYKAGDPLSSRALVTLPPSLRGARSWSLETRRNRGWISTSALDVEGKILAIGGLDGTIRLWDIQAGKLVRALIGHDSYIYGLAFSPGGKYLASAGAFDATIRIWDLKTGMPLKVLRGHPSYVTGVAWTRDGKQLVAIGGNSGDASQWEVTTGIKLRQTSLGQPIRSLAIHPSGNQVALAANQIPLTIWDIKTGKTSRTIGEATDDYVSVAYSPDGKALAAGSGKAVFLFDSATGKLQRKIGAPAGALTWSADGKFLAGSSYPNTKVWNPADGALKHQINTYLYQLHFTPDGKRLAGNDNYSISLWDVALGKGLLHKPVADTVPPIWFSNRPIVTGIGTGLLTLWDQISGKPMRKFEVPGAGVTAFAWSPDGKVLAIAATDQAVRLADPASGKVLHVLKEHKGSVGAVAWSPDGKFLASGGADRLIIVWNGKTGKSVRTLSDSGGPITVLAWSPSVAGLLAGGGGDSKIQLYNVKTWKKTKSITLPSEVHTLAWSGDGRILATGLGNSVIQLWNPFSGKMLGQMKRPGSPPAVSGLAWAPKTLPGILATGFAYHQLTVWDYRSGKDLHTLATMAPVQQLTWSPGGLLASSNADRTCRFFDPVSGKLRGLLLAEADQVIAVSATGHHRAEGPALDELVYVVQTSQSQDTLFPAQFAKQYQWKNNPALARVAK